MPEDMASIFTGTNYIEFDLHFIIEKNKLGSPNVVILSDEEAAKAALDEKKKDKVQKLHTKWLQLNWRAAHDLVTMSMEYNHQTGVDRFNPHKYRDAKLKACLVDWDAKDRDNTPIPCNEMTINNLHWQIAAALVDKYDEAAEPDKEAPAKN